MTNLDIIKYLANNDPERLAELLDDIYCTAWNCGSCAGSTGKIMEECEIDDFYEWINNDAAQSGYYCDEELSLWLAPIERQRNIRCSANVSEVTINDKSSYRYDASKLMEGGSIGCFGPADTFDDAIDKVCESLLDLKNRDVSANTVYKSGGFNFETESSYDGVEECPPDTVPSVFVTGLCTSDDCIDNMIHSPTIIGNAKCPHCGESYYTENFRTTTALYCPPIYKNGVNINKASNTTTANCTCLNCNKEFTI